MATCCQMYCLFLSAFSTLYLCIMVGFGSETIYLEIHNHAASAVALFVSALIYAGITGYYYYIIFMNLDRKEELKRWIEERRMRRGTELGTFQKIEEEERRI